MAGDAHGDKTQEVAETAQDDGREQATQEQPQVSGADWEKAIAERVIRISYDPISSARSALCSLTTTSA